jgi:type III pantothenate kinase
MLLVIDVGNTNIVFALYDHDTMRGRWRMATDHDRTSDEYAVWLRQLLELDGLSFSAIEGVAMASVVPAATENIRRLCVQHLNRKPIIVGDNNVDLGLEIAVDKPNELGADRLANAVGALARYPAPIIVVDFGTATTFDVIDQDQRYYGGIIAPGPTLSSQALTRAAAQLPSIEIAPTQSVIGRDTISAMQAGLYWGYASLIEGLLRRIGAELGKTPTVVATGGLGGLFAKTVTEMRHVDADLTLCGIQRIYQLNMDKT